MSDLYDRTGVKNIVLHHLGDGLTAATTEGELRRRANPPHSGYPNGYEYPEYDYGILANGKVVEMRPLTIIGAHTQADFTLYRSGENWWNRNSASVVIGIDSEKFQPPEAMVLSLITFLGNFCLRQGGDISNIYPHFQISKTKCPGAFLDYDRVERSVDRFLKSGVQQADKAIIIVFGPLDLVLAYRLAQKLGIPIIPRELNWAPQVFNKFYIVGGAPEKGPEFVNLTGDTWEDTARAVLEELKKHG